MRDTAESRRLPISGGPARPGRATALRTEAWPGWRRGRLPPRTLPSAKSTRTAEPHRDRARQSGSADVALPSPLPSRLEAGPTPAPGQALDGHPRRSSRSRSAASRSAGGPADFGSRVAGSRHFVTGRSPRSALPRPAAWMPGPPASGRRRRCCRRVALRPIPRLSSMGSGPQVAQYLRTFELNLAESPSLAYPVGSYWATLVEHWGEGSWTGRDNDGGPGLRLTISHT